MREIFKENRTIATGIAIAAGALRLAGCGEYNEVRGQGIHFKGNTLYVPGGSETKFSTIRCDKTVLKINNELADHTDRNSSYVNDKACFDQKLTPEDLIAKP